VSVYVAIVVERYGTTTWQ